MRKLGAKDSSVYIYTYVNTDCKAPERENSNFIIHAEDNKEKGKTHWQIFMPVRLHTDKLT